MAQITETLRDAAVTVFEAADHPNEVFTSNVAIVKNGADNLSESTPLKHEVHT